MIVVEDNVPQVLCHFFPLLFMIFDMFERFVAVECSPFCMPCEMPRCLSCLEQPDSDLF